MDWKNKLGILGVQALVVFALAFDILWEGNSVDGIL